MVSMQGVGSIAGGQSSESRLFNIVWSSLLDQKYIILRYLLTRSIFDKYFSTGYDYLRELALRQSIRSRGIEEANYYGLLEMHQNEPQIKELKECLDHTLEQWYKETLPFEKLHQKIIPLIPEKRAKGLKGSKIN